MKTKSKRKIFIIVLSVVIVLLIVLNAYIARYIC